MKTADQRYNELEAEIKAIQKELNDKLVNHKKSFNGKNWGYVGDLGYIHEQLKNINSFIR